MTSVPVEKYGKDHWSTFAYLEDLCVNGANGIGQADFRRMRANPATHPLLCKAPGAWMPSYGTRLQGFFGFADRSDPQKAVAAGVMLDGHDDWDCVDDFVAAGLVEILSLANGHIRMTAAGMAMSARLRAHKAAGGMFSDFVPVPVS